VLGALNAKRMAGADGSAGAMAIMANPFAASTANA
jgi:hypothetical protein